MGEFSTKPTSTLGSDSTGNDGNRDAVWPVIVDMHRHYDNNLSTTSPDEHIPSPPMPSKTMSKTPSGPTASRIALWYADAASAVLR